MQQSGGNGSAVGNEARRKLATTLQAVFSEAVYDYPALQNDVCAFVSDLKASGASAQTVIIAARSLVKDAAGSFASSERTNEVLTKMLGWCLDEYYRKST
jgi:hypothetical protein